MRMMTRGTRTVEQCAWQLPWLMMMREAWIHKKPSSELSYQRKSQGSGWTLNNTAKLLCGIWGMGESLCHIAQHTRAILHCPTAQQKAPWLVYAGDWLLLLSNWPRTSQLAKQVQIDLHPPFHPGAHLACSVSISWDTQHTSWLQVSVSVATEFEI